MKIKPINFIFISIFILLVSVCFAQTPTETLSVSGLKENVTIRRDERGIPYIEAKSDADLYFAQGYATASDRLWQMDLYRRVARGETAEIFGKAALEGDRRWRKFGFSQIVEETYKTYTPEHRAILENYARGVNAYIAGLDEKTLPAEFQILKYRPAEWKPTDSMIIGAILADGLSTTWTADVMRASFADLPKEKFDLLFIEKTPFDVLVVGKDNLNRGDAKAQREIQKRNSASPRLGGEILDLALNEEKIRKNSLEKIGFYQEFNTASNNWVISGKKTLDGKPILANDPHLPPSAPSIWYLANLSAPTARVSGVTFPGVPGIVLGHNEHIAWGATNLGPDVQDLYLETFNEKGEYKTPAGWEKAVIRREEIKVRKNPLAPETETEVLEVTETRNGVIFLEDGGKKYALKWTARDPKNDTFGAFLKLNQAKNWEDFKSALKIYGGATQNFIYADVKGNIGYYGAGAIPIRRKGDGSMPYDGATNDGDWVSMIPFAELPNSYNPPENFIVTANQRVSGDSYKHFLSHLWADPYRARRIYQLLEPNKKITVGDVIDVQRDVFNISFSNFAREIVRMEAASAETLNILRGWDGQMKADSAAALFVLRIRQAFLDKILEANVGKERASKYRWGMSNSFIDYLIKEKPAAWLPKEFSDYKSLLIAAENEARLNLTRAYGADQSKWTWGEAVKARFNHQLASVPFIGNVFLVQPFPQNGSGLTPNVGASVSMRHITVPGSWDETRHGIALGQSGDPKSPHWKDQLESWKSGTTPVFPFTKEAVEKTANKVVVMMPK